MVTQEDFTRILKEALPIIKSIANGYANKDYAYSEELCQHGCVRAFERFSSKHGELEKLTKAWVVKAAEWSMLTLLKKDCYRKNVFNQQYVDYSDDDRDGNIFEEADLTVNERAAGKGFVFEQWYDLSNNPENLTSQKERYICLLGMLNSLPAWASGTARLVLLEDEKYREAAQELDVPIGTIMSRVRRARARLKEMIYDNPSFSGDPIIISQKKLEKV